jgi:hypothetical protein
MPATQERAAELKKIPGASDGSVDIRNKIQSVRTDEGIEPSFKFRRKTSEVRNDNFISPTAANGRIQSRHDYRTSRRKAAELLKVFDFADFESIAHDFVRVLCKK